MSTIQYRVAFGKKDEVVEGPDDADAVITVDAKYATSEPTVAYMRGQLKSTGSTAAVLDVLRSGQAAAVLSRLAAR